MADPSLEEAAKLSASLASASRSPPGRRLMANDSFIRRMRPGSRRSPSPADTRAATRRRGSFTTNSPLGESMATVVSLTCTAVAPDCVPAGGRMSGLPLNAYTIAAKGSSWSPGKRSHGGASVMGRFQEGRVATAPRARERRRPPLP